MKEIVKFSFISILFILGINIVSFSQSPNESSLGIQIEKNPEFRDVELYELKITQVFKIGNQGKDSIVLKAPTTMQIQSPQLGLKIDTIIGVSRYKVAQNQLIIYFSKDKIYDFEIFYSYFGNVANLNLIGGNLGSFYYWDANEEFWYFRSTNTKINEISISYPNNFYLLESFSNSKDIISEGTNKETFISRSIQNIPLQFILLNKLKYERKRVVKSNQYLYIYLPIDSTRNLYLNKNNIVKKIESQFDKVICFFDEVTSRNIDVIQIDYNKKGRALGNQIICDSSFFYTHHLLHEFIHVYSEIRTVKNDSGYFFLEESLTEFLAICLNYNSKNRDIYFDRKIAYYSNKSHANKSIFEVDKNSNENWDLIYGKTPFIIHLLSLRLNENEIYRILKDFYIHYSKKEVTFDDFSLFLRNQSVDKEVFSEFIRLL
ncbi:hypothetical protein L21SP5_00453 [Salinivirga cyanobacteriivorans]|uniref:Uncharacterized protein n=2 Tax=Salinivirga cyanobacteriivorans TaxID=1307839 RepID=A0A0S2HVY7_9BACT|nr:hypothetical protein L21SP5_00453 [Salinivirga cyanobacteriivorans]